MVSHGIIKILDAASATGDPVNWQGGRGAFIVRAGTWNGATATLQLQSPDGGAWMSLGTSGALTADGGVGFEAPGCAMRVLITGSPTAVSAWLIGTGIT